MTATKVECREFGVDSGPRVEEVASYAYTVQDENSKPQNGVLIEEFSETEDRRSNLAVNRGVTIVSVSDDESTLKALSRDVSTEDMQSADLPEDQRTANGLFDEPCFNGTEDVRLHRLSRITETILEEPSSAVSSQSLQRESLDTKEMNLPGQSATVNDVSPAKRVAETALDGPEAGVEGEGLSKQRSSGEMPSASAEKTAEGALEEAQTAKVALAGLSKETAKLEEATPSSSEILSRQSSRKATLDEDDGEIDEDMKKLLARVKQQRSVLDEILDKESGRESGTAARFHRQLRQLTLISQRDDSSDVDRASVLSRPADQDLANPLA